ncbi:hypothetical protein [Chryseobacterium artocarpi]|nr:hypothetical protein [Chryseobacterium artocarpi]
MEAINQNNGSQTLFRFATMRSAELSEPKNKERRFIFRNSLRQKGVIDSRVEAGESLKDVCEKIRDLTIETEASLKAKNIEFYELSVWISKNKEKTTKKEFDDKINTYKKSQGSININAAIWDNLIYQTVTQKDFYAKEILIQFLHLDHILSNYYGTQEQYEDVIKAKVVLPKELFKVKESSPANNRTASIAEEKNLNNIPFNKSDIEFAEATASLKRNKDLTIVLEKAERAYLKEYETAYQTAYGDYLEKSRPTQAEYDRQVKGQEYQKEIFLAAGNHEGLSSLKYIPVPDVPVFNFNFRPEIEAESLSRKLSQENTEALHQLFNTSNVVGALKEVSTFTELYQIIERNNQLLQQTILNNTNLTPQTSKTVGGVVIPVIQSVDTQEIPFTTATTRWSLGMGPHTLFVTTDINNPKHIVGGSYHIKSYDQQILASGTTFGTFDAPNVTSLFREEENIQNNTIEKQEFLLLEGEVTLNNGLIYIMQGKLLRTSSNINRFQGTGVFTLKNKRTGGTGGEGGTGNPPITSENPNEIFIPSGFGMKNIGIADYRKVEQSTYCYVEGEVSHIENIMAKEYKEKSTRRLKRSESQITKSTESEKEKLTDTTSTERNEMQSEISKVLQESKDFAAQAGFNASWGGKGSPTYMLNTAANYATHSSKEESNRQAVTEAKDVTARALERIITKVKEERIDKILEEYEENNKHGFDNTKGNNHVVGVYRWVDKIVKNQIFNYGKRMMFEFMIPEPAKLHSLGIKVSNSSENQLIKPIDPRESPGMQIKDWSALTDSTKLKYWLGYYNVQVDEKLEPVVYVGKSIDYSSTESKQASSKSDLIAIPEHYITESYVVRRSASFPGYNGWGNGESLLVGGESSPNAFLKFVREVPITIATTNAHYFHATINIKCVLQEEYKNGWLQKAFNKIIDAYKEELNKYEAALADAKAVGIQIKGSNPGFYRKIENTILRRNCISYMLNQHPEAMLTFGKKRYYTNDNSATETFENTDIKVDEKLDKYAAFIKFIEQAFEWEIMSYYFYPYYWGERKSWADLYQFDDNDPTFRAFMQSGMARVIVTVRPGFEEAVRHFLATGQIWNGGEVPVIDDPLFLSIVDELRSPKATKEGEPWREKIPTSLTILQAGSIGLKVEKALPCNCEPGVKFDDDLGEVCATNFESNDHLLGVETGEGQKIISGDWV